MSQGSGRAWVFGDNVDTDALAPGAYVKYGIDEIARHCLESIDPAFAANVRAGDVLVGGRNFGAGSSREQAAEALRHLGVAAVVAPSFAGIFYRNALNLGLLALVCPSAGRIRAGARVRIDREAAQLVDVDARHRPPLRADSGPPPRHGRGRRPRALARTPARRTTRTPTNPPE